MKVPLYTMDGQRTGEVELPSLVFGVSMNKDLLYQAVRILQARRRRNLAHTKQRSEVRGGGRKPWRQKHTGRARHGSIRSPIWRGGGIAFGPRKERNFTLEFPDAMRRRALAVALSAKVRDGEVAVVEAVTFPEPKTKLAAGAVRSMTQKVFGLALSSKKKPSLLLALPKRDGSVTRAVRNIPNIRDRSAQDLSLLDVLSVRYLVIARQALPVLEARVQTKKRKATTAA